jgi:hypothetical protein
MYGGGASAANGGTGAIGATAASNGSAGVVIRTQTNNATSLLGGR